MAARQPSVAAAVNGNHFPFHPGSRASTTDKKGQWSYKVSNQAPDSRHGENTSPIRASRHGHILPPLLKTSHMQFPRRRPLRRGPTLQRCRCLQGNSRLSPTQRRELREVSRRGLQEGALRQCRWHHPHRGCSRVSPVPRASTTHLPCT
jgi:hypothetical protein